MIGHLFGVKAVFAAIVLYAVAVAVAAEEPKTKPAADWWLAKPAQTDPKILAWAKQYPNLVTLDSLKTFDGHTAYALTIADRKADGDKRAILFSQPHAHEPAATAGMMDFLAQLLDGKHLDGRPTDLNREELLRRTILTFIPDGNPDGRAGRPRTGGTAENTRTTSS